MKAHGVFWGVTPCSMVEIHVQNQ